MTTWELIRTFAIVFLVVYSIFSLYSKTNTILSLKIKEGKRRESLFEELDELVEECNCLSKKYNDLVETMRLYTDLNDMTKCSEIQKELDQLSNEYQRAKNAFNTTKSQLF